MPVGVRNQGASCPPPNCSNEWVNYKVGRSRCSTQLFALSMSQDNVSTCFRKIVRMRRNGPSFISR